MAHDLIATLTNPSTWKPAEDEKDDLAGDNREEKPRAKRKAAVDAARRKIESGLPYIFGQIEKADPEQVNIALTLALLQHAAHETQMESSVVKKYFTRLIAIAARRKVWLPDQNLVQVA
jgi:HrpA-like RNA helicase